MPIVVTGLIYAGAALALTSVALRSGRGCAKGRSAIWLVAGIPSLIAFAWLLTLAAAEHAGRAYAAYAQPQCR